MTINPALQATCDELLMQTYVLHFEMSRSEAAIIVRQIREGKLPVSYLPAAERQEHHD